MTSTELKIGLNTSARPSSRVLKPPGGGHTNIFGEAEVSVNAPRPKYNQQNSSNLNACIGSTDPNQAVEKLREEIEHSKQTPTESNGSDAAGAGNKGGANKDGGNQGDNSAANGGRSRVPPGGYSSGGFW